MRLVARHLRLLSTVALLAVAMQWAAWLTSGGHLAARLAADAPWLGDICSVVSPAAPAPDGSPSAPAMPAGAHCPLCVLAAAVLLPAFSAVLLFALLPPALPAVTAPRGRPSWHDPFDPVLAARPPPLPVR